jgi:integrase
MIKEEVMPRQTRHKTSYPGVYYVEGRGVPGSGHKMERIYYIDYRKGSKRIQEKAGRQYQDDMTPARASGIRARRMEGKELSNAESRAAKKAAKAAEERRWTIARLWDLYCENNPQNKSLRNEQNKFDRYLREGIAQKEPTELLPLDVDRLRISLEKAGKKTTAARVLELLRRTINYGVDKGLVRPIAFKIRIPRLNNQTTEDLSPEQLGRLLRVLDAEENQTAANIMRLALFTGMRRAEIFKLRWDAIDFRRGFITLKDPKGGSNQTIPLNDSAMRVLESIDKQTGNPFVFPGRIKGAHLTDCKKAFKRIAKAAGFPYGFRPLHGLRHTYASMLASSGQVDMYTLQKLLTHKSSVMTARYAHLRDEALRRASNLAGALIDQAVNGNKNKVISIEDED